ncbi:ABC transporter substrate-binding protein [Pseudonocardia kujensis]|uniref:ABC transporter substrate-binding protein n=1 Tax=Pseudonocardia kujensis TaxID=1128675 RepID=UPI001E43D551|nr:ABC transporter substrate-binding protein [Pseudonocardia kujensis]MCE0765038.1 ABC transporter substrate-binding protein [Pseudonocardia kujensis]
MSDTIRTSAPASRRRSRAHGLTVAIAAVLCAVLLAACGSGGSGSFGSSGYGSIALQLSWIKNVEFAGEYFATEKGYYSAAGFSDVKLLAGGGQTGSVEAVVSGQATVGLSQSPATALSITQGAPLKIIGATYQKNPLCLLSLEDRTPIRTVADLRGKRIGVQAGANQQALEAFLRANGVSTSDVTIVPTQYDIAPLIRGDYDAHVSYVTNEPILAAHEGHQPVVLRLADNGLPLVGEALITTDQTIATKRDMLKAFLTAEIKGWTDAVRDPAQSARYAAEVYGKDQDLDVAEQTEEANAQNGLVLSPDVNENGLFTMTDELVDENIKALAAAGVDIRPEQLFDLSLLKEVYAENPSLVQQFDIPRT